MSYKKRIWKERKRTSIMFAPFKSTTLHILSVLSISISISFTCERTFFLLALMFTTCSEGGRARSKLAFFEQNAFKVQTDEFQKEFTDGLWNDSSRGSGKVNRDDDNSHGLRATFASRQAAHTYVCFRYQYVHLIYISRRRVDQRFDTFDQRVKT